MNKPTLKEQAHGEIEKIFRILLPQNGLAVREEQITLCHAMLDTLLKNNIALCDAGVGIGKTYAYLTACILLKKFAPHGPAGSQPVVISTSSVALQDAIIGEYIPFLSRIFLENRVISKPIRAIVRKGKERFVCDARLSQRLEAVKDKNKNTSDVSSEIYLTWFSAFAQAESESISQNVTMGKRRQYKEGHFAFRYKNFLGYRPGENGEPEIDPEQAAIVSRIFFAFLSGDTPEQIAKSLEADHIPSPTGKPTWSKTTIRNMLQNEKYAGDVLLQKTYTADFLEKKVKKNRGEVKQYYITDNHPAIIPRDIFQEVQLEIARRSSKRKVSCRRTKSGRGKYTSKYALSERTVCGECGAMYRRTMWIKRDGTKEDVWRCVNRLEFGTKYCKHSPSLKEPILHQAILNCIQSVFHNKEEIAEAVREAQKKIILFEDAKNNPEVIRQRMQDIDHGMANLLTLAAQSSQTELFEKKFKEMTEEKARLAEQLKQAEEDATTDAKRQKQLDDILRAIDIDIVELTEFDDTFIRRIVEQVTILSKDKIEVRFIGGFSKVGDIPTK